jgi:hypothetical protein
MESKQDITGLSWPRLKVWLARHRANPAAPLKIVPKPELTIRRVMQSTTLNHMNAFSPAETPPISQVTKLFCVNDENLAIEIALRKVCFFNTPNILCPKKESPFPTTYPLYPASLTAPRQPANARLKRLRTSWSTSM